MKDPQFTPGPWQRIHNHPEPKTRYSLAYICAPTKRVPLEIASVYQCDTDPRQYANANLIAAAPEMYEALEYVLECAMSPHHDDWDEVARTVHSALSKARGEVSE